ncbi:MAG: hypothetical protein JSU04_08530 [Bdellovibrionales bacterium]|nr:hypothetical protein [Bdellovibrionales bacterium]
MRNIMKHFLLLVLLTGSAVTAQADLLDRMRLEDTLKNRIEDAFRLYDPKAKALIRFDYKTFSGTLPGTSIETQGQVNPYNIDSGDINRVTIEIFTDLEETPAEAKDYVLRVIPIEKSKVFVEYKKLKTQFPKDIPRPHLDPEALSTIAHDTMSTMAKTMGAIFGGCMLLCFGFMFHQNSKKLKEFKSQIQLLTTALSENASGPAPTPVAATKAQGSSAYGGGGGGSKEFGSLKNLQLESLKEIFADCYWCREDAYAHWLWKNIEGAQKKSLMEQFSLMKDYSLYFVTIQPHEMSYHEHPFYMDPQSLLWTSQEDLSAQIRKDFSLWHFVSPMRQQNLPLSLEERLQAVQTKPEGKKSSFDSKQQSPHRVLETKLSWGEISSEDEAALYSHPEMVPVSLRENIQTLVWLAQKDDAFIQKTLSRYDARSLASAWVGPEAVLKKLEAQLPEKKLKLLLNYREKTAPSRHSDVYASLVAEGFKNEAA